MTHRKQPSGDAARFALSPRLYIGLRTGTQQAEETPVLHGFRWRRSRNEPQAVCGGFSRLGSRSVARLRDLGSRRCISSRFAGARPPLSASRRNVAVVDAIWATAGHDTRGAVGAQQQLEVAAAQRRRPAPEAAPGGGPQVLVARAARRDQARACAGRGARPQPEGSSMTTKARTPWARRLRRAASAVRRADPIHRHVRAMNQATRASAIPARPSPLRRLGC